MKNRPGGTGNESPKMKIYIPKHPTYYGDCTDAEAKRIGDRMADCAELAGFVFEGKCEQKTTDEKRLYVFGESQNEVPWYERWCKFGFRGMVAWLKRRVAIETGNAKRLTIDGMPLRQNLDLPGYWDVLETKAGTITGKITFTGTLSEIRRVAREASR